MPRRKRQPALRAWRLVLVATAAASRTAATWPLGTSRSSSSNTHPSPSLLFGAAEATAAPYHSLQHPRSLRSGRRRGSERHRRTNSGSCSSSSSTSGGSTRDGQRQQSPQQFAPLWVRARGGAAGKRASGVKPPEDAAADDDEQEEDDDGVESAEEEQGEVGDDDSEVETETETADAKGGQGQGEDSAGATAPAAGNSVLDTLDVKTLLPQAIKTGFFFLLARWLGNKLQPTIESHVRAARVIYTAYLVFSQALCMYIRYLIWKKNDDTEMEVPPPPQLKNLMEAGKAGAAAEAAGAAAAAGGGGGAEDAAGGLGGAASSLGPMLDKIMTSKKPVKKYDMNAIQGVRRGQTWAALIMCYTHLRRGMIKPMMLQASFGLLSMLDSPLFHIYVLGREAKGNLARPFKPQGLMASLSGPMEAMTAKAAEAQAAMAAAEAKAEAEAGRAAEEDTQAKEEEEDSKAGSSGGNSSSSSSSSGSGEHQENDDDDVEMPGIEALTDAEE